MAFAGKVVVVTGASSGIGATTAIEFAKEEAILVITGRNEQNLISVRSRCQQKSPKNLEPLVVIADMDKEADIKDIIDKTIETFKKLDVLVNNAGVLESGSIQNTSLDQYDRVMSTNMRGPYYLTHLAVPHLITTKGNIVNVSSVVGIRSFPNVLAYCVSKSALDQFTRCIALELGSKGVRVNSVNPGVIKTGLHLKNEMSESQYQHFIDEKCKESHALQRAGTSLEVAASILYLAGEGASFITGVNLPVDGGRHAMCPR